ncbi:MAG: phosphatidylinositol phosphate kinase family protein [Candidatus Pacebacteria bacterium]|nr:phosphatidylinositol phosphate kinase family protein [Candidatus Paceibacterota bacterium]
MSEEEFHFLRRILPSYYEHVKNHPGTLMTRYGTDSHAGRFYGCHKIIFYRSGIGRCKEFRFVIMNNVFSTGQRIHARYDLKGSTVGRQVLSHPGQTM